MALLIMGGITLGPTLVAENFPGSTADLWQENPSSSVLSAATAAEIATATLVSNKPRAEIINYQVQSGDTVSTIAEKFGVSTDTIRWENNLTSIEAIKPGQALKILPVTGIAHKVSHGDTIYSIAKRYDIGPQGIVDWPYNSFANDETFALAVGQTLIVPDGVMPKAKPWQPREYLAEVPQAGTVTGTGQFVWPAGGNIGQGFRWYHKGIDISNKAAPGIVAADGGTVVVAGWPSPWAYGNRVLIDHGNGFATLYAHLSRIHVSAGQRVGQGQVIGQMGSTGRSTGVHLHFEIRKGGVAVNPLSYLR
ncbi:peptidoglycan DD-metalloendopeptidase family protein [Candidatus Saccharibacteria bacterium]|nr:peptidoglycan DD-metalloendopeptidase family protein [Candidatus Saccharibacteria bacterium]